MSFRTRPPIDVQTQPEQQPSATANVREQPTDEISEPRAEYRSELSCPYAYPRIR